MIFLKDLLGAEDFNQAVNDLAANFMARHNLEKVHQLGLVVPDVEHAAEELEARRIGPFFIATGSPVFWKEKGKDRSVSGKMGLAYHREVELELLEPLKGSDFYTQSLAPDGRIVLQHLGFLVKDVDTYADKAAKAGMPVWVRGQLKAWPSTTEFAYLTPDVENGLIMEFINWHVMGFSVSPPPWLLKTIGRIEKWTGKRCLAL
jgi:hypothetical protein